MIDDFVQLRGDIAYARQFAQGIDKVLDWHNLYVSTLSGMLTDVPHWNFVDWPDEWIWEHTIG